jgi:hypothetical protein
VPMKTVPMKTELYEDRALRRQCPTKTVPA